MMNLLLYKKYRFFNIILHIINFAITVEIRAHFLDGNIMLKIETGEL